MKITKYNHACIVLEHDNETLVIDPGNLSPDFKTPDHVAAIVITHEHADHLDTTHLAAIFEKNPDAVIIGPASLAAPLGDLRFRAAVTDAPMTVGGFELSFYGDKHALIHSSLPQVDNLGVAVNRLFYYPGDAFTVPGTPIDVLAIPDAGPWMRIGEAMDFLVAVHPRFAFPVHDAIASSEGKAIADKLLGQVAAANGITYKRLDGTIEI